jgi:hypothetical protein
MIASVRFYFAPERTSITADFFYRRFSSTIRPGFEFALTRSAQRDAFE